MRPQPGRFDFALRGSCLWQPRYPAGNIHRDTHCQQHMVRSDGPGTRQQQHLQLPDSGIGAIVGPLTAGSSWAAAQYHHRFDIAQNHGCKCTLGRWPIRAPGGLTGTSGATRRRRCSPRCEPLVGPGRASGSSYQNLAIIPSRIARAKQMLRKPSNFAVRGCIRPGPKVTNDALPAISSGKAQLVHGIG
jgi:hypothetical protein